MLATTLPTRPHGAVSLKLLGAVLALGLSAAACSWTWTNGVNYGVVIEPGAARANVEIYRAARRALHDLMYSDGIGTAADALYASAKGPLDKVPELCVSDVCLGASTLHSLAHHIIYDNLGDLQNAIIDATSNTDCLAVTLISYGIITENWTHKGVGCIIGQIT